MNHLTDSLQQINRIDLAEQICLLYWCRAYTTMGSFLVRAQDKYPLIGPDLEKIYTAVSIVNAFLYNERCSISCAM